jgi:hypothetical protein
VESELAPSEREYSGNERDNFTYLPHDLKNTPEGLVIAAINSRSLAIDTVPWNEKLNKIAKLYITSGRGEEKLKQLTDTATQFRINFQKGFKLDDLLLASEKRLRAHRVRPIYKDRPGPV